MTKLHHRFNREAERQKKDDLFFWWFVALLLLQSSFQIVAVQHCISKLAAALKLRLAIVKDVSLKLLKSNLPAFDPGAKPLIPTAIALLDSVLESFVLDHFRGVL